MSEKEIRKEIKQIQAFRKEVTSSDKKATDSLKEAGIYDSKGELQPQYK